MLRSQRPALFGSDEDGCCDDLISIRAALSLAKERILFVVGHGSGSGGQRSTGTRPSEGAVARQLKFLLEARQVMAYRNKTYVVFDGDNDMAYYNLMCGWNKNENIDFSFFDAHDIRTIKNSENETYIKEILRERLKNTKQSIVIIGANTKNLFKFVRWEIETCLKMGIPIVAANINNVRSMDGERCPAILRDTPTLHVSFKAKIIQKALDNFCDNFLEHKTKTNLYYPDSVYKSLGLL
jgi:hypothetical protein